MVDLNRRRLLRGAGALSFLGGTGLLSTLGAAKSWAAETGGYKALVCVYLFGGMDNFDTVLPRDQASYDAFRTVRSSFLNIYDGEEGGSSRDRDALLALNAANAADFGGRQFGLPRQLAPIHDLFEAGEAAIVNNVGTLVEPITRAQLEAGTGRTPERLFSHNDQQSTWLSMGVEGTAFGWGGQFADRVMQSSTGNINPAFLSITTSGHNVFLSGEQTRQYSVPFGGPSSLSILSNQWFTGYDESGRDARRLLEEHLRGAGYDIPNLYAKDVVGAAARALEIDEQYRAARQNRIDFTTPLPDYWLAYQLRAVAEAIQIRQFLDVNRQVFFVGAGGYDTHSEQATYLPRLHDELATSIGSFVASLKEIGAFDDVVLFTASEFGRTLVINGDGSDHGWGSSHFVVGGPVRGRRLYGDFAHGYDIDGPGYWDYGGRPIPAVSVDQFAATLGRWFGLSGSELAEIFPNLPNFDTADLGFLGGGGV